MMRVLRNILRFAPAAAVLALAAVQSARADVTDVMYVGDGSDNSVKVFDAATGSFMGTLVKSQGGLHGPRGLLIVEGGNLLVSDQNVDTSTNGDISLYDSATGKLLNRIVSHNEPNAPAVPRGIITFTSGPPAHTDIFVADFSAETQPKQPATPGRVRVYSAVGAFLRDLPPPIDLPPPNGVPPDRYHPRGLVIGPDGLLYVSSRPGTNEIGLSLGGDVLRFKFNRNLSTWEFVDVFIHEDGGPGHLNGPEGICFGPDGKLYLISFRFDATDKDTIRIYQGPGGASPGTFIDTIPLDDDLQHQPRAWAQALVFGPREQLFVPINGDGPDTGSVRRYNVATKAFDVFVPAAVKGGPLGQPWYPTFGKTNPSTLAYGP
jgi:hypothetical protein